MARAPWQKQHDALMRILRSGEAELDALVADALASGKLGSAAFRRAQLGKVRTILATLQGEAVQRGTEMVALSYAHGGTAVDHLIGSSGPFTGVHQEAVNVIADNLAHKLGEAAATVGRRVDDAFRQEGLRQVASALVTGSARRDNVAAMTERLQQRGVRAFTDAAGREWKLSTYSEMHVRTIVREAASQGTANRLLENGSDLVTISSHDHDEDVCTDYDGKTFSLTGATPGYDVLDNYPPFHPNCEHVLTPAEVDVDRAVAAMENADTLDEVMAAISVG